MKHFGNFVLTLVLPVYLVAQPTSKEKYLLKSNNQKTLGWVVLGTGVVVALIGAATFNYAGTIDGNVNNSTSGVLFATGTVVSLASIPLFMAARRNSKKAMSLSFNARRYYPVENSSYVFRYVPSLELKISL